MQTCNANPFASSSTAVRFWAQHLRLDILLKDGPITAFTSSKVRPIKFELLKDCLRIGDGDWWGKRRDRAPVQVETCDVCRRELWRWRDRARPLVQLGRYCGTAPKRRDILLKDGPITAFTSSTVRRR